MISLFLVVPGCGDRRPANLLLNDTLYRTPRLRSEALEQLDQRSPIGDPCVDFYEYACGAVDRGTVVPSGLAEWNVFHRRSERQLAQMWRVLSTSDSPTAPPGLAAARSYFRSCQQSTSDPARELASLLREIDTVTDSRSLAIVTAKLHQIEVPALFTFDALSRTPTTPARPVLMPGGLAFGNAAPYFDPRLSGVREQYLTTVKLALRALGRPDATIDEMAMHVLAFEARLGRDASTLGDAVARWKVAEPIGLRELSQTSPGFDWETYFAELGLVPTPGIFVTAPQFLTNLSDALQTVETESLRNYLGVRLRLALAFIHYLDDGALPFGQRTLPSWRVCTEATASMFGPDIDAALPEASNRVDQATDLIRYVRDASKERIAEQTLFTEEERRQAMAHIDALAITTKVVAHTPGVQIDESNFAASTLRLRAARHTERIATIKESRPQASVWAGLARSHPAFLSAINTVYLPAVTLDPPWFDPSFPPFVNFAYLGTIIAHEFAHAIDFRTAYGVSGGSALTWWNASSIDESTRRAQCLVDWFDAYSPPVIDERLAWVRFTPPPIKVIGAHTLPENLADYLASHIAYRAYQMWREDHPGEDPEADRRGVVPHSSSPVPARAFFLAYAQQWCTAYAAPRWMILRLSDRHAPPDFRVNGSLAHTPAFVQAFGCPDDTPMNATDCRPW